MTELELRARVCAQAWSWKGRREADGSHREIIDVYNRITPRPRGYKLQYSDAWCAGFVSAVGAACGLTAYIYPECSCPKMIELYRKAGRWMEDDSYLPPPGDVIFYDWQDTGTPADNTGTADHVGVVVEVDGETITVMEGNCGHAVDTRQLQRNGRYIRGYGQPDYAAAAAAINAHEDPVDEPPAPQRPASEPDTPAAVTLPELPAGWHYVPLPDLTYGDGFDEDDGKREAVRAAQYLLKGRGFPVGWMGCDGEFGDKTQSAVGKYRQDRGISTDTVIGIGPETWGKMICE